MNEWIRFSVIALFALPILAGFFSFLFSRQHDNIRRFCQITGGIFLSIAIFLFILTYQKSQTLYFSILTILPNQLSVILCLDRLSGLMLLVSSGFFFLIQNFSLVYLRSDETLPRFIAQLNLLMFAILLLLLSGNLFTAFLGWQFIGLSLYLLLNHYHYDEKANRAAKKKFIINRIGDTAFLLALILTLIVYQTDRFSDLFAAPDRIIHFYQWSMNARSVICLSVLIAIMTKSAQFPFHIWLPDTLETPTPVSAFMHAGVINAGGFLLARLSPWWGGLHYVFYFLFGTGLLTLALAGFLWQTQSDIKKQYAYSTMGQMGYMIMQCGLGLFKAAIFHLIAHGIWKAYLFLSAGEAIERYKQKMIFKNTQQGLLTNGIIVFVITAAAYFCVQSMNVQKQLPVLIWYFVFMALFFWGVYGDKYFRTIKEKLAFRMVQLAVLSVYFGIYLSLDRYLYCVQDYVQTIPFSVQISVIFILMIFQFMLYHLQQGKFKDTNYAKKIYLLSLYKYKIEGLWRRYLLNPFRALGDVFNQLLKGKYAGFQGKRYFFLCINLVFYISESAKWSKSELGLWINIIFLLCFLLAANRTPNLKTLLTDFLMITFSFANIANALGIVQVAKFHLFNIGVLLVASFALLMQKNILVNENLVHNRLTPTAFYLSCMLFLIVGIPGSASFVSEYLVFSSLFKLHPYIVVVLSFAMVSLAIVVLHTLQIYVFNTNVQKYLSKSIPLKIHLLCLIAILFNIFSGCYPKWFELIFGNIT